MHPIKGDVLCYKTLATHLGEDQPFYGLQAQGLDGKSQVPKRIEDIAATYIAEIKTLLPEGPYCLGGYSLGGIIAFEMAQQLHQQGAQVNLVALLDPDPPQFLSTFQRTVRHLKRLSILQTPTSQMAYLWNRFTSRLKQEVAQIQRQLGQPLTPTTHKFLLEETLHQAFSNYIAKPYPGRLTLFKGSDAFVDDDLIPTATVDGLAAWQQLTLQGLEVHQIPGSHADLLQPPSVDVVREKLQQYL